MLPNLEADKAFFEWLMTGELELDQHLILRSTKTGKIVKACKCGNYLRYIYKGVGIQAHRLVYISTAKKLIPERYTINHKDGCKTNNIPANLELATYSENNKHGYAIGLTKVSEKTRQAAKERWTGETNVNSKFSDEEVVELRQQFREKRSQ